MLFFKEHCNSLEINLAINNVLLAYFISTSTSHCHQLPTFPTLDVHSVPTFSANVEGRALCVIWWKIRVRRAGWWLGDFYAVD